MSSPKMKRFLRRKIMELRGIEVKLPKKPQPKLTITGGEKVFPIIKEMKPIEIIDFMKPRKEEVSIPEPIQEAPVVSLLDIKPIELLDMTKVPKAKEEEAEDIYKPKKKSYYLRKKSFGKKKDDDESESA